MRRSGMLTTLSPNKMPLDRFHAELSNVCGSFDVVPAQARKEVLGCVYLETRAGIEMAHIAKDVQTVRRTAKDLKKSPSENFFLIAQEEGSAFMQQHGVTRMLMPGDMILIDSAYPSEFNFFGNFSRQVSLHLPRTELRTRFGDAAKGGHYIQRKDYHAVAISAILSKAFESTTNETQSDYLMEALYGMIGALLYERGNDEARRGIDAEVTCARILERGIAYADRCFADSTVNSQSISEFIGVPLRQLQRAFALAGTTPTDYLLKKRMEKACQMLTIRAKQDNPPLVSSIAYQCGFNDVSYFNRQFRRLFGCPPGQFSEVPITSP